jgi:hypothetical protein
MKKVEQAARQYMRRKYYPPFECGVIVQSSTPKADYGSISRGLRYRGPVWYPAPKEVRSCCGKIKPPSNWFPHNYLNHVKTIGHIARLFNVDKMELKDEIKVLTTHGSFEQDIMRMRLKKKRKG